jgi:hypothetical protein
VWGPHLAHIFQSEIMFFREALLVAIVLLATLVQQVDGSSSGLRRGLQACFVSDFTYHVFENGQETGDYPSSTLDLTDGKINIVAQVSPSECQPKCVKISLGSTGGLVKKERSAPYALFGDVAGKLLPGATKQSGLQDVKACLYTDRNCTVGEYGCRTTSVDIIPANEPLAAGPYVMPPFSLTFNGVDPTTAVSANNTQVAATTICQIINEYWNFGAYYKCDVGVRDFQCTGNMVPPTSGSSATTIEFKTVASVYKGTGFNPYCNLRLPSRDQVFDKMTDLIRFNQDLGPGSCEGSLDYFVNILQRTDPGNPYQAFTSVTVTV